MRLLWARVGIPYSPATGLPIESQTVSQMVDRVLALPEGTRLYLLAPIARGRKGEYRKEFAELQKKGFQRLKIDGRFYEIAEAPDPRQEIQARHRRGGRPHRGAPRHRSARLADFVRDGARADRDGIAIAEFADETAKRVHLLGEVRLPESGFTIEEIEPRLFSFNNPYGACPECDGLGTELFFEPELVVPDENLEPRARRHRAVGAHLRQLALLPADAGIARPRLSPADDQAVEVAAGGFPPGGAVRLRRGRDHLHL